MTSEPPNTAQHIDLAALLSPEGETSAHALLAGFLASEMMIAVFDPHDRLVFSSPDFRAAYAVEKGGQDFETIIRHCHATRSGPLIETDNLDLWLAGALKKRRSVPHRRFEVDMVDGRWLWATETTYDGGWVLLVLQDFTSLKMKEIGLEIARDAAVHEASTDPLTGLANRRSIMRYLDDCADRTDTSMSIALVDIDYFKQINDTFGHEAGDDVLKHFARHCQRIFRNSDHVGRVGGEEFLIVMPNTGEDAAMTALQRFRHHLHRSNQLLPEQLSFTFSAGIATSRKGIAGTALYREADQALYRAKTSGRDCIVPASTLPLPLPPDAAQRGR